MYTDNSLLQTLSTPSDTTTKSPLSRFFERESQLGIQLLATIRSDLSSLVQVCEGSLKQTNHLREQLSQITKGIVPLSWRRYKTQATTVSAWVSDFNKRLLQLERIIRGGFGNETAVELGLLFTANGFITATQQSVANSTSVSLETLKMEVTLEGVGKTGGFLIEGK